MGDRAGCLVVDADGHVIERPEMWAEYFRRQCFIGFEADDACDADDELVETVVRLFRVPGSA